MFLTLGPLRRLAALTIVAALAGTGAISPAGAQAPSSGVTGADLPQVGRVDNIFPYLEGGSRELVRATHLDVPGRRSCFTEGNGFRAESVRWAFYPTADGNTAFFDGLEDPTYFVYEFATTARARQAFDRIAAYVRRCDRAVTEDTVTRRVEGVPVPRLGQRQVGYRTYASYEGDRRQDLEIYVLQGRRLERSWIQLDDGRVSLPRTIRMARLLADVAR